jgi:acetyl-CoA carboxylase carboxyl transferase subunit alpha
LPDYIEALFTEYTAAGGRPGLCRRPCVMGGLARFNDQPVVVIGHEKGNDTKTRIERNFGMARPEGYRKAIRLMDMADRFRLPVITLIDTAGAYPGKGAEERGQAEAIARSTEKCLAIGVPLICVVIGEGGSGGAVAFATANRIAMLEHSVYSVISARGLRLDPVEGCREDARGGRGAAADGAGSAKAGPDRPDRQGTAGRRAARAERGGRGGRQGDRGDAGSWSGKKPEALVKDRRQKFLDDGVQGAGRVIPRCGGRPDVLAGAGDPGPAAGTLDGRLVTFTVETWDDREAPLLVARGRTVTVGAGPSSGWAGRVHRGLDVVPVDVEIGPTRIELSYPSGIGRFYEAKFNGYVLRFETDCALFDNVAIDPRGRR